MNFISLFFASEKKIEKAIVTNAFILNANTNHSLFSSLDAWKITSKNGFTLSSNIYSNSIEWRACEQYYTTQCCYACICTYSRWNNPDADPLLFSALFFISSHRSCIENCFFCSFVCIINWNLFHFRLTYSTRVKLCEGANCIAKVYTYHRFHKNLFYHAVIVNCSKSFNNRLKTIYMKKLRVFSIDCVYINLTLQVCKLLFIIICQKRI